MALNTAHFILISVVGVVFLAFLSLVTWLGVILYKRNRLKKAAQQYQLEVPGESSTQSGDVTDSGGPSKHVTTVTLTNRDFIKHPGRDGDIYEDPYGLVDDVEDHDSGHGTFEDYDKIHIDVIETNIEGVYARPQKSTLKKNSTQTNGELNTMDKNVKFSERIQTVIGDLATPKGSVKITEWDPKT